MKVVAHCFLCVNSEALLTELSTLFELFIQTEMCRRILLPGYRGHSVRAYTKQIYISIKAMTFI